MSEREKTEPPKPERTPVTPDDVVLLEDLAPRSEPRGGARKLVFGEDDPSARPRQHGA